jgi:NADP-reducing hydrogenase subunit HndB
MTTVERKLEADLRKPTAMLAALRKQRKAPSADRCRVRVGMASCGISAGADKVMEEFAAAVERAGLKGVDVIPTGCVGRCDLEPMAEVTRGADPPVLYIRLTPEKAARIVEEHLLGGSIVDEFAE